MMKFGVRVAIGAIIGLALAVALPLLLGPWWVGALAGGLIGPLAFLATFFLWSADRLDEGYEQVLFDRPNTLVSVVMLVAFAGLAFGAGFLGAGPSGPSPEEQAALAQMEESHAVLERLAGEFTLANEAATKGGDAGDLDADLDEARATRATLQAMEIPESLLPVKGNLQKAASGLENAFNALQKCAGGDGTACLDARVAHADAMRGLQLYAEAKAAF